MFDVFSHKMIGCGYIVDTYLIHMVQYYWINILGVFLQDAWLWTQRLPPGTNQHQTPGHSFGIIFALLLFCLLFFYLSLFCYKVLRWSHLDTVLEAMDKSPFSSRLLKKSF